ncbi:MAG: response regulator [Magnetococcales bacterium]|nr:response regulator [Magnetococcales bacterium]MBF0115343.1 response regulator [Magnetococcales bacterium]
MTESIQPIDILLVEDNPGDIALTQEALQESKIYNRLHVVCDGEQAMAFLRGQNGFQNAPRPDLILLDLNLPRRNGREILQEIKQDRSLKAIPVVVLTTSNAEKDIVSSYELHANCYVSKPVDLDKFFQAIRSIEQFWFTIVKLPPAHYSGSAVG